MDPLDDFSPAGRGFSISVGGPNQKTLDVDTNDNAPHLIIVTSWMAASTRHVRPYLSWYRTLYPTATIIHIATSLVDATCRTASSKSQDLAPIVDMIISEVSGCPPALAPRVLVHIFSNGGAWTTAQLATAYRKKTGVGLPATALILDSTPGRATFRRTLSAVSASLTSLPTPFRFTGTALAALALFPLWILQRVGQGDPVERSRQTLNNGLMINPLAYRLYLYSKSDKIVLCADVEDHSKEAEAIGSPVRRVVFDKSSHVGHVRVHKELYWRAVDEVWGNAVKAHC